MGLEIAPAGMDKRAKDRTSGRADAGDGPN
jgi:hypothetical protein